MNIIIVIFFTKLIHQKEEPLKASVTVLCICLENQLLLGRHDENGESRDGTKTTRLAGLRELDAMSFCIDVKNNSEEIHYRSLSVKCCQIVKKGNRPIPTWKISERRLHIKMYLFCWTQLCCNFREFIDQLVTTLQNPL